jgi:hypothetical protein
VHGNSSFRSSSLRLYAHESGCAFWIDFDSICPGGFLECSGFWQTFFFFFFFFFLPFLPFPAHCGHRKAVQLGIQRWECHLFHFDVDCDRFQSFHWLVWFSFSLKVSSCVPALGMHRSVAKFHLDDCCPRHDVAAVSGCFDCCAPSSVLLHSWDLVDHLSRKRIYFR